MKGDSNVISIVLITGIIVTLVSASYFWSVPLLEKGKSNTVYQTSSAFVLGLNEKIIDIANEGGGETSMEMPQGFITTVPIDAVDEKNNSILFDVIITQPMALPATKTYLGGASFFDVLNTETGTFAESSPSIVSFSMKPLGTGYQGTFEIHFRKLVTKEIPSKKFEIVLNKGSKTKETGGSKITISFGGQETKGDTTITKINIFAV